MNPRLNIDPKAFEPVKIDPERKLETMFELQEEMQENSFGVAPTDLAALGSEEERIAFYKDMHIAIIAELQEALDEMGWKPWATSKHFRDEAVQAELVDAFHFFMNLFMVAGGNAEKLFDGYIRKREKNIARQAAGYNGVDLKCPGCKRALDDDAVLCHGYEGQDDCFWCNIKAALFRADGTLIAQEETE